MKFHKLLVFMMVFSLAVFAKASFAQDDDDDDDDMEGTTEEMDEDTWQAQMDEYTAKKTDLTAQLAALETEIGTLKNDLGIKTDIANNAMGTMWSGVGSKAQYDSYKTKFADAEKKIAACKGPDDAEAFEKDVWPEITNAGQDGRMKCLPEFWDRYNKMKKQIADCKALAPKTEGYTVVKGDCLYKIAGMKNVYGNSKLWPAIWEANKNGVVSAPPKVAKTIPNPNLIYPGQVLKIPALTEAQKTEMMNKATNYRKKRVMKTEKSTDSTPKKTEMKKDTTKKK
ncbi:MAG: LysM peptidoglycan-binding domain-containing protein [Ignavibacteria bacterium]|nr:LysM peptidoglycan-binding domain-containing protein [Ignavibacteria bacterium]